MPHKKAVNWVINITIITPEEKQQEFFFSRRFGGSDVTFGRRNLKQLTNLIPRCVFIIYETKKACALPHLWYYIRSLIPPISKWKGKKTKQLLFRILQGESKLIKRHHPTLEWKLFGFARRSGIHWNSQREKIIWENQAETYWNPYKRSEYFIRDADGNIHQTYQGNKLLLMHTIVLVSYVA